MSEHIDLINAYENIPVSIFDSLEEGSHYVAQEIAQLIHKKESEGKMTVLGLATGNTPKLLYAELIRMHREEGLSFKNVITFNLDEYFPMDPQNHSSYHYFMEQHLFNHIDINPANFHIPNSNIAREKLKEFCADYEQKIKDAGGIDLQVLGIGQNGHIGFNEPGSSVNSKTRLVSLESNTRLANSSEFKNISEVPHHAITMGMDTILSAHQIFLIANGKRKASVLKSSIEDRCSEEVPASLLQNHENCRFILDSNAASELTQIKYPWLTRQNEWTPQLIKSAVIDMALRLKKSVLSITDQDYIDFGLSSLIEEKGEAYEVNLQVYYMLRDSITGWPGGKPNSVIPNHPERSEPFPKKVLLFSPHPDDDIISMGGTFMRLHDQGHEVHVAYQTSGNIAVTDEFVTRFLDFVVGFENIFKIESTISKKLFKKASSFIAQKEDLQKDIPEIREIKALIRQCEARATCKYVGIPLDQIHFMNLPFYETGVIEKNPMSQKDIDITVKLIREIKPHQIFCAGDLADPHGTHKVCLDIIIAALNVIKNEADNEWLKDCYVWLYKGAWEEWDIDKIEMAIPMSPGQVRKKRYGIFIHQSQKDSVPFKGSDKREFWKRAEERNANTAELYASLGLTKYAAMEAFVRYHF
jgi:glucosamine-6-phosphate deaminase